MDATPKDRRDYQAAAMRYNYSTTKAKVMPRPRLW